MTLLAVAVGVGGAIPALAVIGVFFYVFYRMGYDKARQDYLYGKKKK